jgi:demethylmenaquinone methyltransferase/2-methoxy-6-polyprenyl-1,4-benzoquinol methylase
MSGGDQLIRALEVNEPLRHDVMCEVVGAFAPAPGSRGLDVGCGIGGQTRLLAEAVGPCGHVTGIDVSGEVLARATEDAVAAGLQDRVYFAAADMRDLPVADDSVDWLWSSDCIGYPCGDPMPALREAARVVTPGGRIAVSAWTSQVLLPGHAMLEARLNATCSAYAPHLEAARGETQFLCARRWFERAGLTLVTARTFVGEVRAPLDAAIRAALAALFEMLWGVPRPGAAGADVAEFRRLCRPDSAGFIGDVPGYYGFFTYTVVGGTVPLS